jgi:hypothetical protein
MGEPLPWDWLSDLEHDLIGKIILDVTVRRDNGAVSINNAAALLGRRPCHTWPRSFRLLLLADRQRYHGSLSSSWSWHATMRGITPIHYTSGDIDRAVAIMDSDNSVAVSWKKAKIRFLQVAGLHVVCSLLKLTSHQHSVFPHLVL